MKSQVQDTEVISFPSQKGPQGKLSPGWGPEQPGQCSSRCPRGSLPPTPWAICDWIYLQCPLLGLVWRRLPLRRGTGLRGPVRLSVLQWDTYWYHPSPGNSAGHKMLSFLLLLSVLFWIWSDSLRQAFGLPSLHCSEGPGARPPTGWASGWLTSSPGPDTWGFQLGRAFIFWNAAQP